MGNKQQSPTGKPINTEAGKALKDTLLKINDERQKEWITRLFTVWYLVWRYLDQEESWQDFYLEYNFVLSLSLGLERLQEMISLSVESVLKGELDQDELLTLLFHVMGLPWAVFELALSED